MANKTTTIIVVEDEPDISEVIAYNLQREGYAVDTAARGDTGLELVRQVLPDLVILDLMLPGLDGLTVCRRMKAETATRKIPIIMVSARGEEADVVVGLGLGADDYVAKPFSTRELIARVAAVLRRTAARAPAEGEPLVIDGLVIDIGRYEVRVDGTPVKLTATEFRILNHMASQPGRVFTRSQILNAVAADRVDVIDRNIDVHIRSVRKKLGTHAGLIETVRGVGYRFGGA